MTARTWGFGLAASLAATVLVVDGLAGQRVHADLRHAHWRLLHVAMETQNLSSVCWVLHHLGIGRRPGIDLKKSTLIKHVFMTLSFYLSPATSHIILYWMNTTQDLLYGCHLPQHQVLFSWEAFMSCTIPSSISHAVEPCRSSMGQIIFFNRQAG